MKPILLLFIIFLSTASGYANTRERSLNQINSEAIAVNENNSFFNILFKTNKLQLKDEDTQKWNLLLGGWYERRKGDIDRTKSNANIKIKYDNGISFLSSDYKISYEKTIETLREKESELNIKYNYYIFTRIDFFIFNDYEKNSITRLRYRTNSGSGIKFILFRNIFWTIDSSFAPIFQYEKFDFDEEIKNNDYRASFRFRINISPIEEMKINLTYFYVPKFETFDVYRKKLNLSLKFKLFDLYFSHSSIISFETGYEYKHNNDPINSIFSTDKKIYTKLNIEI